MGPTIAGFAATGGQAGRRAAVGPKRPRSVTRGAEAHDAGVRGSVSLLPLGARSELTRFSIRRALSGGPCQSAGITSLENSSTERLDSSNERSPKASRHRQ